MKSTRLITALAGILALCWQVQAFFPFPIGPVQDTTKEATRAQENTEQAAIEGVKQSTKALEDGLNAVKSSLQIPAQQKIAGANARAKSSEPVTSVLDPEKSLTMMTNLANAYNALGNGNAENNVTNQTALLAAIANSAGVVKTVREANEQAQSDEQVTKSQARTASTLAQQMLEWNAAKMTQRTTSMMAQNRKFINKQKANQALMQTY